MLKGILGDLWHGLGFGRPLEGPRSPSWARTEACAFIRDGFRCRWCGRSDDEVRLVGHHVVPFHERPDLELELTNVLTMCQPLGGGCHLHQGHRDPATGLCRWTACNPNVIAEAAAVTAARQAE